MCAPRRTANTTRNSTWKNFPLSCRKLQIRYVYAGKELGGRPTDPTCYKASQIPDAVTTDYLHEVNYPEVMKRTWFEQGIGQLLELAAGSTTCIMCSEEDPAHCHRHHLIASYLMEAHPEVEILHIRGDGNLSRHPQIHTTVDEPAEQLSLLDLA